MSDSYAINQNDTLYNQSPELLLTRVRSSMQFFKTIRPNITKSNEVRIGELSNRVKKYNKVLAYYKAWINKANKKYEEYRVQLSNIIGNLKLIGNKYKQTEVEKKLIDARFALMSKIKFAESRIKQISDNRGKYTEEMNQLNSLSNKKTK